MAREAIDARTRAVPELPEPPRQAAGPKERRRYDRTPVLLSGTLLVDDREIDCIIMNLSVNGAKVRCKEPFKRGVRLLFRAHRFGDFVCDVAWQKDDRMGLAFRDSPDRVAEIIGKSLPLIR